MHFIDLTLPTPTENLALDEALLEACEAGELTQGVLRIWEPDDYFVVLGRSSQPAIEVNLAACKIANVPIVRRASGGGTVLAGPGCLMYAVLLSYHDCPELKSISRAHQVILNCHAAGLAPFIAGISFAGTSDLVFLNSARALVKFSGNSMRAKRTHLLYHGTLLYDFDLPRVSEFLAWPTREPNYRAGRSHGEFIANLPVKRELLVRSLVEAWQANQALGTWPEERMKRIVKEKYADDPKWVIS